MADLSKIVDDLSSLTVLEAAELSKLLEEKWGVSAAAPVAVAAAGGGRRCSGRGREDRVRRGAHRGGRQEDQRHQGSARHHRTRPEGSEGPRRGRSEDGQGRREQGRGREAQEEARRQSAPRSSSSRRSAKSSGRGVRARIRWAERPVEARSAARFHWPQGRVADPIRRTASPCDFPDSRSKRLARTIMARATTAKKVSFSGRRRIRKFFGHITEAAEMPNLIEVQKSSYDQFLMVEEPEGGRGDEGLQAVFKSVFPISDFAGTSHARIRRATSSIRRNTTSRSAGSAT